MTSPKKRTLLWLEDVPKTAEELFYSAEDDFVVKQVSQLHDFVNILNDPSSKVKGIVLDVMLYGVYDLSDFGIQDVDTDMGSEAGWRILEHYLRAPDSKFRDIPVLVLSVRFFKKENEKLLERLNHKEGVAPAIFIEKRERKKGEKNWTEKFKDWLKDIR